MSKTRENIQIQQVKPAGNKINPMSKTKAERGTEPEFNG